MKTYLQFAGLFALAAVIACGDDTETGGNNPGGGGAGGGAAGPGGGGEGGEGAQGGEGGMGASGGGGAGGGIPARPEPLAQIDRMGRPAINTALTDTFVIGNDTTGAIEGVSADDTRAAAQDAYNADGSENDWDVSFGTFAANLAVLDALDTGVGGLSNVDACGNQPGAGTQTTTGERYALVAGVLANDRLWVNTAGEGCSAADPGFGSGYLALEAAALGGGETTACGGRRPIDDTIDVTYTVVSGTFPTPFGDGIDAPSSNPGEVFPYMAPPH